MAETKGVTVCFVSEEEKKQHPPTVSEDWVPGGGFVGGVLAQGLSESSSQLRGCHTSGSDRCVCVGGVHSTFITWLWAADLSYLPCGLTCPHGLGAALNN